MDFNDKTSSDLEKTSSVSASMIRHICGFNPASVDKLGKLSDATGIPPLVLFFPKENIGFDVKNCKPHINRLSRKCAAV
jgi:hypothetical protein